MENSIIIIFDTPLIYPNKRGKWSHLVSNDLNALHAFVKKIGHTGRFQNKKKKGKKQPHYDLPEFLVPAALSAGAKQVTRKELLLFLEAHFY